MLDLEERDDYDELPQAIKDRYSRKNYMWLPNEIKRDLVQLETEPDVE